MAAPAAAAPASHHTPARHRRRAGEGVRGRRLARLVSRISGGDEIRILKDMRRGA